MPEISAGVEGQCSTGLHLNVGHEQTFYLIYILILFQFQELYGFVVALVVFWSNINYCVLNVLKSF